MTVPHSNTVRDWVQLGADRFASAQLHFGHGTDNAWDEALALVLHVLQRPLEGSAELAELELDANQVDAIDALYQQRIAARVPAAYLTGSSWFAGLKFAVNRSVLVPRSPVAELIESGFAPWVQFDGPALALDLCTGSGCIAIALAHHLPELTVDATDLSADALIVAAQNVARHGMRERVHLHQGDLYQPVRGRQYDLIVSNPPYVGEREMQSLPAEYLAEPSLALVSADDGLNLPLQVLVGAADYLRRDGVLVLEVGNSDQALQQRLPQVPFVWLEFERGGHGVCLLERQQLLDHRDDFAQALRVQNN